MYGAKSELTSVIGWLASKDLLEMCSKEQIADLVNILVERLEDADAEDFKVSIENLLQFNLLNKCGNAVEKLTEILIERSKNENDKKLVASVAQYLADAGLLQQLKKKQIVGLTNMLIECSKSDEARVAAVATIRSFVDFNFFKQCTPGQINELVEGLIECLKNMKDVRQL